VVCSRNRPKLLAETVASVLEGDRVPDEIIVVDQSEAPHPELSRWAHVTYIFTSSRGLSRGRNEGIAASHHPLLALTDDDVRAPRSWFGSLIEALESAGPRAVVTGRVIDGAPENADAIALSIKNELLPETYEGRPGIDVLFTNNMAIRRSAFQTIGLFDERLGPGTTYSAAEDNDLGFRLLEAGYRIVYAPEAAIYHRSWRTTRDFLPMRWAYGRGQGGFLAKHVDLRDRYMLRRLGDATKRHIGGAIRHLATHQRLRAYGDLVYTAALLSGAAQWLLTERSSDHPSMHHGSCEQE
jgi:GT2 family glycosyltransferase